MKKSSSYIAMAGAAIVAAGLLVYLNSFSGAFIFDDDYTILANPHLKRLWPITEAMRAPIRSPVRDRPVVNLSLALTYAAGGLRPGAYHAVNLAIHLAAALVLFGVLRRTFENRACGEAVNRAAFGLALAVSLLWVVHPLQTESVTYITQRCESLMGLFYLAVLYCVIRGDRSPRRGWWSAAAVVGCALGMGCKASMVTSPILVLAYDRIFLSSSWEDLWRRRKGLYAALAATWLIQACLLLTTPYEDIKTHSVFEYARSQPEVIVHYLKLAFWPHPLCLDYSWPPAATAGEILPPALIILGFLGITVWGIIKNPASGFLGVWFFLILAPTSSLMPLEDLAFEHRMYLPLLAVLAGAVVGGYLLLVRLIPRDRFARRLIALVLIGACLAVLSILTIARNRDYHRPIEMWENVVALRPDNFRAWMHLGNAYLKGGNPEAALESYRASLRVKPDYHPSHYNLANLLAGRERFAEAEAHYRRALEIEPKAVEVMNNLGALLARQGKMEEAVRQFEKALGVDPLDPAAWYNLGLVLAQRGKREEAGRCFEKVIELKPDYDPARQALEGLK